METAEILPMTKPDRKPRATKRVSIDSFNETCKVLSLEPRALCEAMGYDPSAYRHWIEAKNMPKVAALACEELRRRNGEEKNHLWIVKTYTKAENEALKSFATALGIKALAVL